MDEQGTNRTFRAAGRNFVIRDTVSGDLSAVTDLHAYNTGQVEPDYWYSTFARYGDSANGFFLTAEAEDGELAGFIIGEVRAWEFGSEPCGWIYTIGVQPGLREYGIGCQLYETISLKFREAGVGLVRTMLHRKDTLNLSFFRSQGMAGGPYIELEMHLDDPEPGT